MQPLNLVMSKNLIFMILTTLTNLISASSSTPLSPLSTPLALKISLSARNPANVEMIVAKSVAIAAAAKKLMTYAMVKKLMTNAMVKKLMTNQKIALLRWQTRLAIAPMMLALVLKRLSYVPMKPANVLIRPVQPLQKQPLRMLSLTKRKAVRTMTLRTMTLRTPTMKRTKRMKSSMNTRVRKRKAKSPGGCSSMVDGE